MYLSHINLFREVKTMTVEKVSIGNTSKDCEK
jgi:hypothetical protein